MHRRSLTRRARLAGRLERAVALCNFCFGVLKLRTLRRSEQPHSISKTLRLDWLQMHAKHHSRHVRYPPTGVRQCRKSERELEGTTPPASIRPPAARLRALAIYILVSSGPVSSTRVPTEIFSRDFCTNAHTHASPCALLCLYKRTDTQTHAVAPSGSRMRNPHIDSSNFPHFALH